jgi:hypothetical protein
MSLVVAEFVAGIGLRGGVNVDSYKSKAVQGAGCPSGTQGKSALPVLVASGDRAELGNRRGFGTEGSVCNNRDRDRIQCY